MATKHEVLDLHWRGVGQAEIARRLDCCVGYVNATLQRLRKPERREKEIASEARRRAARKAAREIVRTTNG